MPPNNSQPATPGLQGIITSYFVTDSSHGGDGSGGHVGDADDSDPETNVDLDRTGLDADPGDTPVDGMDTSPSPRRRRRSTEGSMTTNTSANPLVSPPQRIRLDDQSDIVFQDAPSPIPTGLTIDHIAVMIRDQRSENREQSRAESKVPREPRSGKWGVGLRRWKAE